MAEKLKPCPFCGGEAELKSTNYFSVVKCKGCRVSGPVAKISVEYCANDKAAESWNRRKDNG